MERKLDEDQFRHDLRHFTFFVGSRYGFDNKTSISIGEGESLDIDPSYNYGIVIRLISYDDRAGYERSLSVVLRRTADIDFVDENLRYKPLGSVDRFEASSRIIQAQEALKNIAII